MKKLVLSIFCLFCIASLNAFADCSRQSVVVPVSKTPLETCQDNQECNFLCWCLKKCDLYKSLGLSKTQICRADKIQDNYEFDTLSLREKLKCEEETLSNLLKRCACDKEVKAQKKKIKALKKDLKKTCKCYSDEFKALLSDSQTKQYKKMIKEKCPEKCGQKCKDVCDD